MKYLSSIAIDVIHSSALKLNTSADKLVGEFGLSECKAEDSVSYSRKLVEFCFGKALVEDCKFIEDKITDASFSRFTFDAMLAWDSPSSSPHQLSNSLESEGKEREDPKRITAQVGQQEQDDISLFYSDLMPLLVDNEPSVEEDAFVWLASLVPLAADVTNGRFTFETLTAPTGNRLFYPAYDKFLREIYKCIKHLQKQSTPTGVEFADDEFILHVEGTASSQRVVRHIGGTSWPGRLTLTNYAVYFEASKAIAYDDALKIDLSKDIEHSVKPTATGPWGAPLFDKAVVYESPELLEFCRTEILLTRDDNGTDLHSNFHHFKTGTSYQQQKKISEGIVLEFPEMTSSTRRDHWLALIKEVILLHQFILKYKVECPIQSWEMHSRTILGIIRLHAAREMLRISPPTPTKFMIFALFDELPKGDYVLEELANSLKKVSSGHSCSASSILRSLNMPISGLSSMEVSELGNVSISRESTSVHDASELLESAIHQSREEGKEVEIAKATAEGLKEEGIGESATVLMELLKPVQCVLPQIQKVINWERPAITIIVICTCLLIFYKEWFGKGIAGLLIWTVWKMLQARLGGATAEKRDEIVVSTSSGQKTTVESIVAAQFGLKTIHEVMQVTNIAILKIWSIMSSKAPKHTDSVMVAISVLAIIFALIPLKYIVMKITLYIFVITSPFGKRYLANEQGNRRLKEWWDSIPIIHVRLEENAPQPPT